MTRTPSIRRRRHEQRARTTTGSGPIARRTGANARYEALDEEPELDEPLADPEGLLSLRESVL